MIITCFFLYNKRAGPVAGKAIHAVVLLQYGYGSRNSSSHQSLDINSATLPVCEIGSQQLQQPKC
jgi:hypothetical protein